MVGIDTHLNGRLSGALPTGVAWSGFTNCLFTARRRKSYPCHLSWQGIAPTIVEHIYGVVNIKSKMIVHLETEPRNNSMSAAEICTLAQSRPFISKQK